jgi:hypothetical protein
VGCVCTLTLISLGRIDFPDYPEIRETVGFKNIALTNVLAAKAPNEELTFIHPDDVELYNKWDVKALEMQVANHELLAPGSGKLFQEAADGSMNFDPEKVINPLTGQNVTSWYRPGETPDTILGEVSSSMEECRAETVALFLVNNPRILELFGVGFYILGCHPYLISPVVHRQANLGGGAIRHIPPHGPCRSSWPRVLRPRNKETPPSAHASPSGHHSASHQRRPRLA